MQIEVGKVYRTRNGRQAVVIGFWPNANAKEAQPVSFPFRVIVDGDETLYTVNGGYSDECEDPLDIVAPWESEQLGPAAFPGDLRDWFAGQTLKGLLASPFINGGMEQANNPDMAMQLVVGSAWKFADAMMKARDA